MCVCVCVYVCVYVQYVCMYICMRGEMEACRHVLYNVMHWFMVNNGADPNVRK